MKSSLFNVHGFSVVYFLLFPTLTHFLPILPAYPTFMIQSSFEIKTGHVGPVFLFNLKSITDRLLNLDMLAVKVELPCRYQNVAQDKVLG